MLNLLFLILTSFAKEPIKIAVIDSGFKLEYINKIPLCNVNYYDKTMHDTIGHGTNITGLIQKHAGPSGYCFIIIKALPATIDVSNLAISLATALKVDIINYSGGSKEFNLKEQTIIKKYIKQGGIFVAAAGNESTRLSNLYCNFYPACSVPEIEVIGNLHGEKTNFGPKVDFMIDGNNKEAYGITMTGSSQAAAIYTGMLVKYWIKHGGK